MSGVASDRHSLDQQLRGSSVLLAGRLLSKFINFGIQVAIIRLLTKDDFGAFAYGLALAGTGEVLVKMGLGHGANRFVPYYFERGEFGRMLGTLLLVVITILLLGAFAFAVLWWVAGQGLPGMPAGEGASVVLLLALLAPIQALDQVSVQTLACFSRHWQIFFRKHVIAPGLRALAVLIAFLAGGDSHLLAAVYLAGGIAGLLFCIHLVLRELVKHRIIARFRELEVPWRSLLDYSLPLISSDLVIIVMTGVTTVLLMATGGESEVASMRAVAPAAALNMLVVQSFSILFLPSAARMFAREDFKGMSRHHWESVAWVSVLSFPIFAVTFCIAPKLVVLLFGSDYADSALILAILSVGSFAGVLTAFSSEGLQVLNRTRPLVVGNFLTMGASAGLAYVLCPEYGALGAAIAVTVARLLGVSIRQAALVRSQRMASPPRAIRFMWLQLAAGTVAASLVGWVWQPGLALQLAVLAIIGLVLMRYCARILDVAQTFPELLKMPLFKRVVVG